jgi:hypothetical protein
MANVLLIPRLAHYYNYYATGTTVARLGAGVGGKVRIYPSRQTLSTRLIRKALDETRAQRPLTHSVGTNFRARIGISPTLMYRTVFIVLDKREWGKFSRDLGVWMQG